MKNTEQIKSYLGHHKTEVENFTKLGDKEKLSYHQGIVFFIENVLLKDGKNILLKDELVIFAKYLLPSFYTDVAINKIVDDYLTNPH
jgi:hypothetical protein